MSIFKKLVDGVVEDLVANVPELAKCTVHRYSPQAMELMEADGFPHLAVFPTGDDATAPTSEIPFTTMSTMVRHNLVIAYWEPSEEGDEHQANEDAALALMDLAERCRARFLDEGNRAMPPAFLIRWTGSAFGVGGAQDSGLVRWWVATVEAFVPLSHTP